MKPLFALLMILSFTAPVSATLITVNSTDYNVEWAIGNFDDINSAYDLMSQIWWGNESLALEFAGALGFVEDMDVQASIGPSFAYDLQGSVSYLVAAQNSAQFPLATFSLDGASFPDYEIAWAYVVEEDKQTVPEPSSLMLLLLGMTGLLLNRKRRVE
ncbi:PEP-CTERM sorting domain-containing protein [Aestuariicella hydrocarbonica]|uniref:PEP-CTERM sorting domain-containing protein n=1 Tax=Pseudomaricurvus hydrocarbonicus TaxID=1470433 RepID=A0A9E5MMX4_9GAMM|nr:PEP-CTERM sorting domain-containing protein [Aestuariicella hydrocarbonica]NHO67177.1 PEP-CTERM sorting domain-containing protein [Aestuariicella hydrocarbonica]